MNSLGLSLIIRYFLHQLLAIFVSNNLPEVEKNTHLAAAELLFVFTVISVSFFLRNFSQELFVVGLAGMCHVFLMMCAMGFQAKYVSLIYLFVVFVAIGPVLSLCIIVDRETRQSPKAMTIPLCSIAFCIASFQDLTLPVCSSIVAICSVHLLHLIEGHISLDRNLKLLRRLRKEHRMRRRMERWSEWARRPHQVHHFPRTVSRGLYRNDGQARIHPIRRAPIRVYKGFEIIGN